MFIQRIQCESCANSFAYDPMRDRHMGFEMPDGWMVLGKAPLQGCEGLHFCSIACLDIWVQAQKVAPNKE